MRCPFPPVSIRPRLKISFEDRLQDQLECPLNHTITDRRKRKHADFTPVFRYLLLPPPHGRIRAGDQLLPYLPEKPLQAPFFDGLERDPVYSWCPVVCLRHPVGFVKRLPLADVDV